MKTGKDLGIMPLKLQNKVSNKELDELFNNIQDEIYFFGLLYYNKSVKQYMMDKLTDVGKKISQLSVNEMVGKRKQELLQVLRKYYQILKKYEVDDDIEQEAKMSKFQVSMFLREKQTPVEFEEFYIKWLKKLHKLNTFYVLGDSLKSVNKECIQYFEL